MNYKKILGTVLISIIIVVIALFLVCAGQRSGANLGFDDSMSASGDEEDYRDQLLNMLDLGEEGSDGSTQAEATEDFASSEEPDVLSLLGAEESESTPATPKSQTEASSKESGLSEDIYLNIQEEVGRLEKMLNDRASAADSLRQAINDRTSRISDLENRIKNYRSGASSGLVASNEQTQSVPAASGSNFSSNARYEQSEQGNFQAGSTDFRGRYDFARGRFESRDYQGGISEFERLLGESQNWQLADNCQYWIGECHYGLRDYSRAIAEFEKVFSFQADDKYDDATLMIGLCYFRLGQNDRARNEFEELINRFPGSEYIRTAEKYLARI